MPDWSARQVSRLLVPPEQSEDIAIEYNKHCVSIFKELWVDEWVTNGPHWVHERNCQEPY